MTERPILFCSYCGAKLVAANARSCASCGAELVEVPSHDADASTTAAGQATRTPSGVEVSIRTIGGKPPSQPANPVRANPPARRTSLVAVLIAIVAVVAILGGIAYGGYVTGLWGARPTPAVIYITPKPASPAPATPTPLG